MLRNPVADQRLIQVGRALARDCSRSLVRSLASGIACVVALILACSCAYEAGYGDRQLPGGYRTIAVPMFKNKTHEAGVEVYFTNAMVRELERLRIGRVTDKAEAQVTLDGVVNSIVYTPVNTVTDSQAPIPQQTILNTQYRIDINLTLRLLRNSDQKVLWEGSFAREQTYLAPTVGIAGLTGANALYDQSARYQNISVMANELMAEAHDRLTENF